VNNFLWTLFVQKKQISNFGQKLTKMATVKRFTTFGEHLRTLREEAQQTLREVANSIGIDPSLLAKIERNERQPTKQIIKDVATFFKVDAKELQNEFLSDQIAYKILDEEADLDILKVAEKKVSYLKTLRNG
jgi:transcriptional regulator with XRE-family HTH domain